MNYLDIQLVSDCAEIPTPAMMQTWVDAVLKDSEHDSEIVIRLVDEQESAELNAQYRHKSGPTNILSFPFEAPEGLELDLLGDLVVCAPLLALEAAQQQKPLLAHWAHIVVHGVLHLLGYDHLEEAEAEEMEALEKEFMQALGYPDPYKDDEI